MVTYSIPLPVKNSSGKHRKKKKSSGILAGMVFLVQKINSSKQEYACRKPHR